MKFFFSLLLLLSLSFSEPLLDSWFLEGSRSYARIYQYESDVTNETSYTEWTHPNSGSGQAERTYAGVHEVSYDNNFVYVRSTGLGSHLMGPWWRNRNNSTTDANIFVNWPGSYSYILSIPKLSFPNDPTPPANRTLTAGGAIGMFVDGVAMFDSRDTFSYDSGAGEDATPGNGLAGSGWWERDAFVNESQTFDAANAHQAGETYHYHANPPGLRYQLGDSVTYDASNNIYSEVIGGNGNHSPILGWTRDGLPIYGPYGYNDALNANSPVTRMISGFQMRSDLATTGALRSAYPAWSIRAKGALPAGEEGPAVSNDFPRGQYLQDYEYLGDLGQTQGTDFHLDEYNTRYCVTPEFPNGVRAYFVSIEQDGTPKYPYNIGRQYFAAPTGTAYNNSDTRANNDFTDPGGRTIHAQGGPESDAECPEIEALSGSDDVVLTWTGVEGGTYEITTSTDLSAVTEMQDKTISALTNGKPTGTMTDASILPSEEKKFYQVAAQSVAPFDDTGFVLDAITEASQTATLTITLDTTAPSNLLAVPNSITLNGEAVEFVSRPTQNEITIYYDSSTLIGGEVLSVIFPGASSPITGTYAPFGATPSNVLFIIVDDWGIDSSPIDNFSGALNGAAGAGGVDLPEMPNLVNLTSSSVRFTNGYVQAACSTTRMAIMSGRLPSSNGVGSPGLTANTRDAANIMTIAEAIDTSGSSYASGLFGKWHLGNGTGVSGLGPKADGWDTFFGALTGNLANYYDWARTDIDELPVNRLGNPANELTYATVANTDDALDFINGQDNAATPWLCWVAYNAPHSQSATPTFPSPPTTLNGVTYTGALSTNRDNYKAALWALDNELNRLLSNIDLTTTTLIFVGDNGTPGSVMADNNLFANNHGKGSIYDGGLHVPFLIRPAGGTTGRTIDDPVSDVDIFPTMTELMGFDASSLGEDLDGESLIPLINGTGTTDGMIVGETFQANNSGRAIRKGNFKLNIHDDPLDATDTPVVEFFNLSTSLQENATDDLLRAGYTMSVAEQNAYDDLLAENDQLNVGRSITYTTSAPTVPNIITTNLNMTGLSGVNQSTGATVNQVPQLTSSSGNAVALQSVTIGGVAATNFSRTTDGTTADRYWVTFDFDVNSSGLSTGVHDIVVQYSGGPRVFTVTGGYNHP